MGNKDNLQPQHDSWKVIVERFLLWGTLAGLLAIGIYSLIQFIGK